MRLPAIATATFLLLFPLSFTVHSLNIALHSQAKYNSFGWVAGSEITTAGIKRALEELQVLDPPPTGQSHHVQVFAPFSYDGLSEIQWDLAIIEGYIGSVPTFIRKMRAINPNVLIFQYCLDTYPTLQHIMSLDVDGFLTNSRILLPQLATLAPTRYVPLAADPTIMRPILSSKYVNHTIVYLGHNSPGKPTLHRMLRETLKHGLTIYGHKWQDAPEDLKARWRGVLPLNDIAELYSGADIVLGTTEGKQQQLGMINNRVYETLGCGSVLISDSFDVIEQEFGNLVYFDRHPGDTDKLVRRLLYTEEGQQELITKGKEGRRRILEHESWSHRVMTMLELYYILQATKTTTNPQRPLRPRVLIVGSLSKSSTTWIQKNLLNNDVIEREFRIVNSSDLEKTTDAQLLSIYSLIIVVGHDASKQFRERLNKGLSTEQNKNQQTNDLRRDQYGVLSKKMYIDIQDDVHRSNDSNDDVLYDLVLHHNRITSSLAQHMLSVLSSARKSATASLSPQTTKTIFHAGETIPFYVTLHHFLPPDDGMWCVRVNGIEVQCVGDLQHVVALKVPNVSVMSIQVVLRTHIDRNAFKMENIVHYNVSTLIEEHIFIDGLEKTLAIHDDRSLYQNVFTFCDDHMLKRVDCHVLMNRMLEKAPRALSWKSRTDRKLQIAYMIELENRDMVELEQSMLRRVNIVANLDPQLFEVIVLLLIDDTLRTKQMVKGVNDMAWVKQLTDMHVGVVHVKVASELMTSLKDDINTRTQLYSMQDTKTNLLVELNEEQSAMIQPVINALVGLDVLEFVQYHPVEPQEKTLQEANRYAKLVHLTAKTMGVTVMPSHMIGDGPAWRNITLCSTTLMDGAIKIPPLAQASFLSKDRAAVFFYQSAQALTGELEINIEQHRYPDMTQRSLAQALPLFERRLRLHRGVPMNEWITTPVWNYDTSIQMQMHNQMFQQILQHREENTLPHIIASGKKHWKAAKEDTTTGQKVLRYPKITGYFPGEYKSRGNFFVTAKHKILHDAEQLKYIVERGYLPTLFLKVAQNYTAVHDTLMLTKQVNQYTFMDARYFEMIGTTYNWFNYKHHLPVILNGHAVTVDNQKYQMAEKEYFSDKNSPGLTVIDNIFSNKALHALLEYLRASTIWFDVKNGYLGTYMNTGLSGPLLLQIEKELRARLPNVLKTYPLRTVWAYKCFDTMPEGLAIHADAAAVNLNIWLTPDDAIVNEKEDEDGGVSEGSGGGGGGGGLAVYLTKNLPKDWTFSQMNELSQVGEIQSFLKETKSEERKISYRQNRAVLFHSRLFHETMKFKLKKGYKNARINLTFLFGFQ